MTRDQLETLPTSRKEARARGLDQFFTGIPCKRGHLAPRYVTNTNCVACQRDHARRCGGWQARPSSAAYLEEARKRIKQHGGILLSTVYVSAKTKLRIQCGVGHEFEVTPDNLKRERWCPECKRQSHSKRMALKLWSVEKLRLFARERHGGDCLANAPAPMLSKVIWKCRKDEHPPFKAVIAKVLRGQWCPVCWQERREPPKPAISFDRVAEVIRERGGKTFRPASRTAAAARAAQATARHADARTRAPGAGACARQQDGARCLGAVIGVAPIGCLRSRQREKRPSEGRMRLRPCVS
jgi:hypothetical protein